MYQQKWLKLMILRKNTCNNNPNYSQICDHLYKLFILWGSRFGKIDALLNLISPQPDVNKNCLYSTSLYLFEAKYQLLINISEVRGLKHWNDSKTFFEYLSNMNDIYENIGGCNVNKGHKYWLYFLILLLSCFAIKNSTNSNKFIC